MFFRVANRTSITSPVFDLPILWMMHSKTEKNGQLCHVATPGPWSSLSHFLAQPRPKVVVHSRGQYAHHGQRWPVYFPWERPNSWELGKGRWCASMSAQNSGPFVVILYEFMTNLEVWASFLGFLMQPGESPCPSAMVLHGSRLLLQEAEDQDLPKLSLAKLSSKHWTAIPLGFHIIKKTKKNLKHVYLVYLKQSC